MSQYKIEYAKSNRAGCRRCSNTIDKDIPRIGKLVPSDKFDGEIYVWFHVPCFFEKHTVTKDELQGFSMVRPSDQTQVLKYISSTQPKKRTNDDNFEQEEPKKQKSEDPKLLQKLWDYIDMGKTICTGSEIQEILELNQQSTRGSFQELAYRVSDGLLNGAVPPCPDCKNRTLVYEDGKYICYGEATAWSKCNFQCDSESISIRRTSWNSPKWFTFRMKEHFDNKSGRSSYSSTTSSSNRNNSSIPFVEIQNEIFDGTTFCLVGKFSKPRGLVIKDLKKHGAIIAMNNNLDSVDYLITDSSSAAAASPGTANNDDVDSETIAVIREANQKGIPVLKEDFLWDSIEQKKQQKSAQYKFSLKVAPKLPVFPALIPFPLHQAQSSTGNSSDDDISVKNPSTPSSNPFHGRTVEDPDPYFKDNNIPVQVYKDKKNNLYSTILNRADLSVGLRGLNSFYEIQALENTQKKQLFYLFKRWGRVGTAGSYKCVEFEILEAVVEAFKEAFSDKTGNQWEDRDRFVKKPNKFYPVGVDTHLENDQRVSTYLEVSKSSKSSLDPRVADIVSLIFDLKLMKNTLAKLDIDLAKMPLGKLTKSQIRGGYVCLSEIQDTLGKPNTRAKILELTNKFYTLIPQDFGAKRPPMIDTADMVADKILLLETLSNIQIALGMLESDTNDNSDMIDSSYTKLCTKLTPLEKSTPLYEMIEKYASSPNQWWTIKVLEIFKVERDGEQQRFAPWQYNPNRKLLWHGSGLANYVGILSQGLRIAPPEAPVSGYRFGKGIYFADFVTKSAAYCRASIEEPVALMMLNGVALGNMYETLDDEYMEKPPSGFDSTKAVGTCVPDPAFDKVMDDGVVVPLGPPVNNELESSCYDNEYIVYDVSQVKIRFLLKVQLY